MDEVRRVLKPDGLLVTLDFYLPERAWWRDTFLTYLRIAGGMAGWLAHRAPETYGYIAASLRRWCSASAFSASLQRHGFRELDCHHYLGGGIAVHAARSAPAAALDTRAA